MSKDSKETELNSFLKQKKLNDEVLKTLSLVLESMAEGVNVSNDKGIILFTNPAFDNVFGYNQDELIGKHVSELTTYSSEESARLYTEINQNLDAHKVWTGEFSNKRKDGTVFYTEARISALELRGKRCLISVQSDITQRKILETALKESETKYRIVSENTYDWGFWISPEKKFIYLSPSCKRITGYDADDFLTDPNLINRIIHPEDQPLFASHRAEAEKQLHSDEIEFRIIRKDGTLCWIGHVCQPVFDNDGTFLGTRASNRDFTKRKLAEEALRMTEEKYRLVADFTYDWEEWLDPSGKYIYMSPSCEWITGYHRDELSDMDMVLKITHPDDREVVRKYFHEILSGSIEIHHMDFRIITRSGDERWISHYCQPVYSKDGTYIGRRGSNRDITERKEIEQKLKQLTDELKRYNVELQSVNDKLKAEIEVRERMQNALEQSEERYKRMVGAVTAYTYSVQFSGGHAINTEHSIGCLPITGYSTDEFKSDRNLWYSMIYPDDKIMVENTIKEIMVGKKVLPIEHRIISRDGAVVWIRNTIAPYYNDDGALIRYDGLIEDISYRKHAEEELKHLSDELKRSNEDLNRFASAVSHDLQEPLRGIEGFVKLLEKRYKSKLDEKADEFIDYVVDDVKRMQMLIKDLLEYSRISAKGKVFRPANCSVVIEQALSNLRSAIEESGAKVTYDLLPTVMSDEAQLIRLFQNLIGNAIKFRSLEPLKIHVSAKREGNEWIFSVRDTGIGIDPKQAERIFVIFQRLHTRQEYPGTGIGLAICKRIVERHGGRIWVESNPGEGATFYFTIPEIQENL